MKKRILDLLACPECKGALSLRAEHAVGEDIVVGNLSCACGNNYRITNSVPRFVESDTYATSFSYEWTRFKMIQLDSANKSGETMTGFKSITEINPPELTGGVILDAGCGTGRYIEVVAPHAREIFGVDLSESVESAQELVGKRGNVHIIQADINKLPFKDSTFDGIYSIGVLHHTPDTRTSFHKLPPLLKPGGWIAIWVYTKKGLLKTIERPFYNFYRFFTTRLPLDVVLKLAYISVPLWYVYKVFPPIYVIVPFGRHPDWKHRVLDTFDAYTPRYTHQHTPEEVTGWFKEAGLSDIKVTLGGDGGKGKRLDLRPIGLGVITLTLENIGVKGKKTKDTVKNNAKQR